MARNPVSVSFVSSRCLVNHSISSKRTRPNSNAWSTTILGRCQPLQAVSRRARQADLRIACRGFSAPVTGWGCARQDLSTSDRRTHPDNSKQGLVSGKPRQHQPVATRHLWFLRSLKFNTRFSRHPLLLRSGSRDPPAARARVHRAICAMRGAPPRRWTARGCGRLVRARWTTAWCGPAETALDDEALLVVRYQDQRSNARDSARTQRRLL